MPTIIDYKTVLESLEAKGYRCLYHNSGAFGFASEATHIGWIGKPDPSIREAARTHTRQLDEPFVPNLVEAAIQAWRTMLPVAVWLMPKSHWSYELQFGNADWLPQALAAIGLNAESLKELNNAAAIEVDDEQTFKSLLTSLLENLHGSDFMLVFPDHSTVCTVHHHQQLWWQSARPEIIESLRKV